MSNNREQVFVKVDVDKPLRRSKTLPKNQFLKEVVYSRAILNSKNWRLEQGNKGLMLKEDYENGLFSAYGLTAERVNGQTEAKVLAEVNVNLQTELEAMKAKVAELEANLTEKEKGTTKKKDNKPNE